ncbi:DUF3618 domain-containing protein [Actinoallomurus spadix]|uniref:DUF3618 domain-containing protein n=1 Tax=Actinoallomurus spadix TaxID=79912 RepID=A0ABN0WYV4_9ACTN|nr:DUF3618 domain-containing protein [Actinoallomurus spadix]MCO5989702.1 DUF3618 domain-containing protein [Actinoallomurus spadix]
MSDSPTADGAEENAKQNKAQAGDQEELKAEIEQTREELGETVEALAAKANVPARVRGKATQFRDQATDTLGTLTQTVREKAPQLREQATGTFGTLTQTVREKAPQLREQATGTIGTLTQTVREKAPQVREQVAGPVAKVGQAVPEPARRTVARTGRQATRAASERPEVLYAAAAVCVAAGVWLWRRGRKRR